MMKRVLSAVAVFLSLSSAAYAADDIDEVAAAVAANPAPAPGTPMRLKAVKAMSLQAAGADSGFKDYVYNATGELNVTKGSGRISLNFAVDRHFTEIESAKIVFNAYDVDYPEATEHDVAHFNDASYIRLQGGNNAWHQNSFSVPPERIRLPETTGQIANNSFYVTVDIDDGGWVTSIGWARLEIRGKEGIVLEASDGTEPDCVRLEWNAGGVTDVFAVYRDGAAIAQGLTDTTYEDYDVEWGKTYSYSVKGRNCGESNPDDGYPGTIPMVTDVEVAELWLTGEGPYNLRLKWNDFDPEKVRVNNVKFKVVRVREVSDKFEYSVNARTSMRETVPEDFDLSKDGHRIENGHHGEYTIEITWDAYAVKRGRIITDQDANYRGEPMKREGVSAKVYFHKYERDVGDISNWYRYWIKDGALSDTSRLKIDKAESFDDCYHFSDRLPENVLAACSHYRETGSYDRPNVKYPPMKYYLGALCDKYRCSDLVASRKTSMQAGSYGEVGVTAYGIKSFAANIPHERKHGDLHKEVAAPGKICLGDAQRYNYSNAFFPGFLPTSFSLSDVLADLEKNGYKDTTYYNLLNGCINGRFAYTCDLDGDGVEDRAESALGFSSLTANTYSWMWSNYVLYADNEILAREAEKNAITVNEANDWAFPGCQIPANDNSSAPQSGCTKSEWGSRKATWQKKLQTVGSSASVAMTAAFKLASSAAEPFCQSEAIETFPEEFDQGDFEMRVPSASLMAVAAAAGGKYESLRATICIVNQAADSVECLVEGFFADADGRPVACAYRQVALDKGNNDVVLDVSGPLIYAQRSYGYALKYVRITRADDEFSRACGWSSDIAQTSRTYQYSEFCSPEAMVIGGEFEGMSSDGNLVANCHVELASGAMLYDVSATLESTNGDYIASTVIRSINGAGQRDVRIEFSRDDIYLSKIDGPYVLEMVQLKKGSTVVSAKTNLCRSNAYTYKDFAPALLPLIVNEDAFTVVKRVGNDGLISGLDCKFAAIGKLSIDVPYQVSMYLYGVDDQFVASASSGFVLKPGVNEIAAAFDADQIRRRNVRGPYRVKTVVLQPSGGKGSPERFFPKMEPIDLNPEDFGAYPFELQGDPAVTTGSGAAAYSVSVPLKILRANKVTVTALMVDAEGRYVATAAKSVQYDAPGATVMSISFSEEDIQASGRRGPYTIRYLRIESDLQGVAPLRVTSFRSEPIERQYQLYVDAARPDDSGDGLTPATAKRTIQAAVDRAKDGDVVVVANGTYEPFDADNKRIEIVSRFGYQYTIVDGGSVRRCATLGHEEAQTNTVLRGFTLQNGDTTGDELVLWNCGGGVCGGTVQNCHIIGCHASKGGGTYYGRLENCLIENNEADTYGGGSYYGTRVNCTIVGNWASYSGGGTYYGTSVNSIIWSNSYGSYTLYEGNWSNGSFDHCVTTPCPTGNGNRAADPGFTKPGSGDYTLSSGSVCIDAGRADAVATATDLAGNPRIAGTGVDIGAFEQPRNPFVYGQADFVRSVLEVSEGGTVTLEVWGGLENAASSVYLYLPSVDGTTKDIDLTKVKVDGKTVKNAKFPLKLTWGAGELSARRVSIPVKTDSSVEGGEILYFQLGKTSGMALGAYRLCQVVVKDKSVPSVSLATAANSTGLKVTTSGSGKWKAANGNGYYVSGEDRGGYHLVTPKLSKGKQAKLTFSGVKGKGNMVVMFRFTGDTAERTSSTLKIYAGKKLMRTYYHSSTGNGWQRYTIEDATTSSHTYSYVFTQGSDSGTHVELVGSYFQPKGKSTPFMVYVTTLNSNYGSVTGMGFYRSGQTVKIAAKANPGHVFKGWYKWSEDDGKYVYWTKTAKTSIKAAEKLDIAALFAPYATVTPLSWQPERGTVSGGGACASGKKVTLKAKAGKGYVFAGWYLNGARVSLSTTYKAPCPSGNVIYYAYFVTTGEDKKSVVASVGGLSFAAGGAAPVTKATQTTTCGVTVKWPVAAEALSSTSVKVTGLPTGLKYDAKKKAIVGVPTKTGTKTATVAVTTAGKSTVKFSMTIKVNPLPSWAKGNFEGFGNMDDKPRRVTFTVSSVGKLSGTVAFAGETWKLAVSSYAAEHDGWFEASAKATKGKSSKSVKVIVCKSEHGGFAYSETSGFAFDAEQNRWASDSSLKALATKLKGRVVKIGDDLTVTIGKAGAVTAKLKTKQGTFSASATLLPVYGEDGSPSSYLVGLRFAPNTKKKFKGAVRVVDIVPELDMEP